MAEEFKVGDRVIYREKFKNLSLTGTVVKPKDEEGKVTVKLDSGGIRHLVTGFFKRLPQELTLREIETIRIDVQKQKKVLESLSKVEWRRLDELWTGKAENKLTDIERAELKALIKKLKANNPDDPDIQGLKV
jgi:hypothetical protein